MVGSKKKYGNFLEESEFFGSSKLFSSKIRKNQDFYVEYIKKKISIELNKKTAFRQSFIYFLFRREI